jgi:xanthine dehydrogenase/oxidase
VDLQPHEVLARVFVPWTRHGEFMREFKQSPRREDDIAIVNAGERAGAAWAPSNSEPP